MAQRHWCFTWYAGDEDWRVRVFENDEILPKLLRYATWQVEECPETKRQHVQGYAEFTRGVRRRQAQELLRTPGAHLEVRRGTRDQARDYCQKEDTRIEGPFEVGTWDRSQGKRSDLDAVKDALDAGDSMQKISDEHFGAFLRYHRGIQQWKLLHTVRRNWPMEIVVLWGPTGTGKTRRAWTEAPDAYGLPPSQGHSGVGWWDGYDGHETVIIDEYYGWLRYSFFLQLLDRYPLRVETKGGSCELVAKKLYITSNKPPHEWYDGNKFPYAPIERRLTSVVHMTDDSEGFQ